VLATGKKVSLSAVRQDATDSHLSPVAVPRGPTQLTLHFVPAFWHLPMRFAAALICRRRHHRTMVVTSTIAATAAVQRLFTPHETSEQSTFNDHRYQ